MLKKIFKVGKIILITLVSVFVIVNLLWELSSLMMTRNSNKIYSPDRRYYAQVEEINGGATTSFMTDVMISDSRSMIINFGFLYTGNEDNRGWIFGFDGALDSVKPSWLDNHTLKIRYSKCSKISGQDKTWKDVKIVYEGKCSEDN